MKFVPVDKLKVGMRLAKPIYNKKGVMLYERDSKLTSQGISSIENFGLIGIYILEPAEPLPPMTDEDREFERFQTVSVFKIKDFFDDILSGKQPDKLDMFVAELLKNYGKRRSKITFAQSLRSMEDNVYKHSLNVAILCSVITGQLTFTYEEQKKIVTAAILHDIGSLDIPVQIAAKKNSDLTEEDIAAIEKYRDGGYRTLRENCDFDTEIMRYISYMLRDIKEMGKAAPEADKRPKDMAVEVLKVAYMYDTLTAMKYGDEPHSDIAAYKFLKHPMNRMSQAVVAALAYAINIVPAGCTVQFENGTKGIVLTENQDDILRPFILSFKDNQIYNLADNRVFEEFKIKDVLKTLDNRYVMTDKYEQYMNNLASGNEKILKVGQ